MNWEPPANRLSVEEMLKRTNHDRLENLIPLRHFRMSASPFSFYRGTAGMMAHDLGAAERSNILVQAIGDCHLMNFGGYATPERNLVFDINDFDETYPASWEWDVKRLAASFVLATRHLGMSDALAKELTYALGQSYRKSVLDFSKMTLLDLWYMKFDIKAIRNSIKNRHVKELMDQAIRRAERITHDSVFYEITQSVLGSYEITDQKPLIYHPANMNEHRKLLENFFGIYRKTINTDRQYLFNQYKLVDVVLKVVGVGSVGTRCYVALLMNESNEPLFLQVKEARHSALEDYSKKKNYKHQGRRVIEGQRLVQAASDIFLGWSTGPEGRHFYIRQLRDRKLAPRIEFFDAEILLGYARLCGQMLARAHVKTSNGAFLAGYLGKSDQMETVLADFAITYADQTERDYQSFMNAIKKGHLVIASEEEVSNI